jgi:hypothetical protein
VEAPSSIQRIEPFPGSALALLSLVPPRSGEVKELGALFEQEPLLLAAVGKVAVAYGAYIAGDVPDFRRMLERMGSAELLKIAITVSVRGYMQRSTFSKIAATGFIRWPARSLARRSRRPARAQS